MFSSVSTARGRSGRIAGTVITCGCAARWECSVRAGSAVIRETRNMMPDSESEKPISHVVPKVSISVNGVRIATHFDLTVDVGTNDSFVNFTQEQFLTLLQWGQYVVHNEWCPPPTVDVGANGSFVNFTQEQFLTLLQWGQYVVHNEWR